MQKQSDRYAGFASYTTLLVSLGFVSPRTDAQQCWGTWQRICEDREVLKRVKKREGKNFSGSVSGYSHGAAVLAAMSSKDLSALKNRLGIKPEREYAVVR
jgi:hypothetical protein